MRLLLVLLIFWAAFFASTNCKFRLPEETARGWMIWWPYCGPGAAPWERQSLHLVMEDR